jgi:hypothetical protein
VNDIWKWLGEQFGNVVGVLALVTGFWFYWLSRKPKRFGWELISKTRIISKSSRDLPLTVEYDGLPVESPNIVVVRVGNTGKAELRAQDFDGPVRLEFARSILMSASVSKKLDESITVDFVRADDSISFTPTLLNAGEWIEFQFVTNGDLEAPSIHARVAGQDGRVLDVDKRKRAWEPWAVVGLLIATMSPFGASQFLGEEGIGIGLLVAAAGFLLFIIAKTQQRLRPAWGKVRRTRETRPAEQLI